MSKTINLDQRRVILKHLQSGKTITPMKAYIVYGVYRLAARIHELREADHDIITAYKHDERGRAYAEYSLRA